MWKSISGFDLYEINEFGVVRNAETRYVTTQRMNRHGYLYVQLYDGKSNHCCLVHRLVAEAFIPNPYNLPLVNHIDECCVHNSADNLEWISYKGNSNHGTRNERIVRDRKIPILGFNEQSETIYRFASRYDAANALGVSEHAIRAAMKNHNRCVSLYWRRDDHESAEIEQKHNQEWINEKTSMRPDKSHRGKTAVASVDESGIIIDSYNSISEAAAIMGVSGPAISNAIKNKTKCKSYRWIII